MKNRKIAVWPIIILAAAVLVVAVVTLTVVLPMRKASDQNIQSSADIHVDPIEGLDPDFIMGADVSMLRQIELSGGRFHVNGVEQDCLETLKNHGVNWIRLRIWNDPTDERGEPLGGGNNDLERTVEIAVRAKALGLKFLLDFHYSDWWADPGKQNKPKAWEGLGPEELNRAVYDYTAEVIQTLAEAGAMPDMVQIGNEVNGGMIWPDGKTWSQGSEEIGGYDGFAALLKQGIQAVRDNDPNNDDPEKRTRIMIHLADGGDNELYRRVFDALIERGVDFDIIGLSYYSFWHGTLNELKNNMYDISRRYDKDVAIVEAAYAFTLDNGDGLANLFDENDQEIGGYKATVQGQATAIRDVIAAVAQVPDGRGLGIFYWEPDWIPVEGAGWQTGEENAWDNLAMFGFDGNALPSLNVFNLVRPKPGRASVPATITEIYPIEIRIPVDEILKLPATVLAAYSDDSLKRVVAIWEKVDPTKLQTAGTFTMTGTVAHTDLKAIAQITVGTEKNYLENPGFETGDFTPWIVEGTIEAVDISNEAANVHEGDYALHYWLDGPFEFTVSQTITGLENGTYSVSAWIQGGGEEETLQLSAGGYGGDTLTVDITNTGWQEWKNPTIKGILVTNGECTITLKVVSAGGSWAFFDEVGLFREK